MMAMMTTLCGSAVRRNNARFCVCSLLGVWRDRLLLVTDDLADERPAENKDTSVLHAVIDALHRKDRRDLSRS